MSAEPPPRLGALCFGPGEVLFRVWSPDARRADLVLKKDGRRRPMERRPGGYFELATAAADGDRYRLSLDGGKPLPDPASRFQPQGVHGPSQIVDPELYRWADQGWLGVPQEELVFYELHVGTFTEAGTFAAARQRLGDLARLGITALELMPVAEFSGRWSWGYDPAALYAPSRAYGTPEELRELVDGAHRLGLAVFLDVVYNHFGPDGAYAAAFAPFHDPHRHTPWGAAMDLDGEGAAGARGFFIDNALHWLREYHLDGLRLDAVHAIGDGGEPHFLSELAAAVAELPGRRRYLAAEDERNQRAVLDPRGRGGHGLDMVWSDDFHHQVRNLVAGDRQGYYADFAPSNAAELASTLRQGWFYTGQQRRARGGRRGTDPRGLTARRFVFCLQNHDQVGNRPDGARLHHEIPPSVYRAVSALLLFAPQLPLLFMGQEWATTAPFLYFADYRGELGQQVAEGRKRELRDFPGFAGEVPDPRCRETFERSRLRWNERQLALHSGVLALYGELLALRRQLRGELFAESHGKCGLSLQRGPHRLLLALEDGLELPAAAGEELLLHTEESRFAGSSAAPAHRGSRLRFTVASAAVFRSPGPVGDAGP